MSTDLKPFTAVINIIACDYNLKDFKCRINPFKKMTQNYFGVLIPVSLSGMCDNKNFDINIVIKVPPMDERYLISGAIRQMFIREFFVYSDLFKKYSLLQKQYISKADCFVMPKCFYACDEISKEIIVMEDMQMKGYLPQITDQFLDLHHITVSVKALAKLHSLSFILQENDKSYFSNAANVCVPLLSSNNQRFFTILLNRLDKAHENLVDTKYTKYITNLIDNYINNVESAYYKTSVKCLCHGDIWKENILFKYEGTEPTAACLIDYQTMRVSSPAYDLLYLITTSTDNLLRQKHYKSLLNIYYKEMKTFLQEATLSISDLYPLDRFEDDLKIVAPACLIVANTALWLSNGLQEDGHVRSIQKWVTEEEKNLAMNRYKDIVKAIIDDYCCYGYLD